MSDLFRLLRPKQWAKNLLVFAAFLFSGRAATGEGIDRVLLAFLAMGLVSSATYIVNDLLDVARDRAHSTKRNRPLASGRVSTSVAVILAVILAVLGLGIAFGLNRASGLTVAAYVGLQAFYNAGLKRLPVADVFLISSGFLLRAILSATAISVAISSWLVLCSMSIALMLGFAKRRHEFVTQGEDRATSRESLAGYSLRSLDAFVQVFAGAAIVLYMLYTIDSKTGRDHPLLIFTAPFVMYGIGRYLLLVFAAEEGGEPADLLFADRQLLFSVAGFVVMAAYAFTGASAPFLER